MKTITWTILVLSLALVQMACSPASAPAFPPPPAAPSATPAPVATATLTARTTEPTAAAPTPAPTAVSLQAFSYPPLDGLDQLDGYSLSLQIAFRGTRDRQPFVRTDRYTRVYWRELRAWFTTVESTDAGGGSIEWLYGSVGAIRYWRRARGEACQVSWGAGQTFDDTHPAALLWPVQRGKEIGVETVDGISARHYALTLASFADSGAAAIDGDIWLAGDRYVVKYDLRIRGGADVFGQGVEGEQTYAYGVQDITAGKPLTIPEGCPAPSADLPTPPDAAKVVRTPTGLTYTTAAPLDAIVAFYAQKMPALGWEPAGSAAPTPAAPAAVDILMLEFERVQAREHLLIRIQKQGTGSSVEAQIIAEP